LRHIYLYKAKKKKAKVHPPDKLKNIKTQKKALHWRSRPSVFIGVNRAEMLLLFLPHVRQREVLAWDGQIGPVILGASIDYRFVGSCCMS
jgi:hypothetical protein